MIELEKANRKVVSEIDFEVPTWNQIYEMLLNMAERIRNDCFEPDIIVGVSRGGWPPARVLSDLLDNPNLANVRAEFYLGVGETKEKPLLTQPVSMDVTEKRVLIVDEVADSGKSLRLVKEHIIDQGAYEVKLAVVYYKPWSIILPDYYVKESSRWIVFPWEIRETIKKLAKRCIERKQSFEREIENLVKLGITKELIKRFSREILGEECC
ncbi:MAG: phosphoribosyltransferase [Candidatus Bathyarchaeota archaeon]|jgi:hypoxanthine phosphoribosyltransferase